MNGVDDVVCVKRKPPKNNVLIGFSNHLSLLLPSVGHMPILGKRHYVEEMHLAGRHARRACNKMGKKESWQEKYWVKGKRGCRGGKNERPTCKKT
jgi:hypothetical protein